MVLKQTVVAAQSTSSAAAARQPDDPLLLDGCTISIKWPHKGETRDRKGVIKFTPKPGGQRRYVVRMEWQGGGTRETSTNWKHLKRREYTVVSSPYKKGHRWTDTELEAAKRRRRAPVRESDKSIGVSLGRSGPAVYSKLVMTLDPEYEPQPRKKGLRGPRMDWRGKVIRAMEQMPGQCGTAQDVCAKVEEILGKNNPLLDRSIQSGTKGLEKWRKRVQMTLGTNRDVFVLTDKTADNIAYTGEPGSKIHSFLPIWQYSPPVEGTLQPRNRPRRKSTTWAAPSCPARPRR